MTAYTPLRPLNGAYQHNLPATPTADGGTTVTASGSAHTKGSWASLIDPVSYDTTMLFVAVSNVRASGANSRTLLDLAIGPTGGGSEQIIVPDILVGGLSSNTYGVNAGYYLPIRVPKGARLSARCQSVATSKNIVVAVWAYSGGAFWPVYTACDAYGPDTATSGGVSHTAGNSGAESSWASVGSAASRAYTGFLPVVALGSVTAYNGIQYHFEFGYNSGSPTFDETWFHTDTGEAGKGFPNHVRPVAIASGTQVQARGEASGTAQALDVAWYGFY